MTFEQNYQQPIETESSNTAFRENILAQNYLAMGIRSTIPYPQDLTNNNDSSVNGRLNTGTVGDTHIEFGPPVEPRQQFPAPSEVLPGAPNNNPKHFESQVVNYQDGTHRELILDQSGSVTAVENPDGSRWIRTTPAPDGKYHWKVLGGPDHHREEDKDFVGAVSFDKGSKDFQVISRFDNNSGVPRHFVQHGNGGKEEFYERTGVKTTTSADGSVVKIQESANHTREIHYQVDPSTHHRKELNYVDNDNGKITETYKDQNGNWHQDKIGGKTPATDTSGQSQTNRHDGHKHNAPNPSDHGRTPLQPEQQTVNSFRVA